MANSLQWAYFHTQKKFTELEQNTIEKQNSQSNPMHVYLISNTDFKQTSFQIRARQIATA